VVDGDFAIIHNQLNVMNCVDVVQWIAIENDQVCLKTGGIAPMSFEIPNITPVSTSPIVLPPSASSQSRLAPPYRQTGGMDHSVYSRW
jgi:hypothetical protein